jgi:PPK2 family polyphosphate:nucleotide phosphotransferase
MDDLERAEPGFSLSAIDAASTPGFDGNKSDGQAALAEGAAELYDLQERLFAESRSGGKRSVLLILQAMDTAGKGGILNHVVGAMSPQGVKTVAFKAPTAEELEHDFLWRVRRELPPFGIVGVFDRSHYEDVLIHRVRSLSTPDVIEKRYDLIREFETELVNDGTTLIKVMLHISPDEQKDRLRERLDRPDKHWKYNPSDIDERAYWAAYQEAYQLAIDKTSTPDAPWYVVPANKKWFARLAVQRLLRDALREMNPQWPTAAFNLEAEKVRLAAS